MTDTKRATIYLRVSSLGQAEHGNGRELQLDRCTAMIEAKGWNLAGVYEDNGVSGKTMDRPGMHELRQACEAGEVDAVVAYDLSRIGRTTVGVLELAEDLRRWHVDLVSVTESIDTSSPVGEMVFTLLAATAQMNRRLLLETLANGRDARARFDGVRGAPKAAYGYARVPGTKPAEVTVVKSEAQVVRTIFRMRSTHTLRAIAEHLNSLGTGRTWYASSVQAVLKREDRYAGHVSHWPSILGGAA